MNYPLYDMNCDDFESLAILICNHLLGEATIPFAKGKDGGKDGKFIGRANKLPSESSPWEGKFIIQAKHTTKINASCSDSSFDTLLKNEVIPAIQKLQKSNDIDFYLLFTNRKLTGIKDSTIEKRILTETGIRSILFAEEKIQMLLKEYPDVVRQARLNNLLLPIDFDETDLRDVIIFLRDKIATTNKISPEVGKYPGIEHKNELNNLSKYYFDSVILQSMADFDKIRQFLTSNINKDIADIYRDAASELNAKIALRRDQYYEFEQVLEAIHDKFVGNNSSLIKGKKRLVRILLHYMYCNCDIGIKE